MPIGIPAAMLISSLVGAGTSVAGSLLSGKPKTSQQTSSTTPTLTPEMQALMDRLSKFSTDSIDNPQAGFAPIKNAAVDNVNRNYMSLTPRISKQFASRGYGSSGGLGDTMLQTEFARGGDLSQLEGQFADRALTQRNFGANLGANLLNFGKGSSSSGTSTGPDMSLSNGLLSAGNGISNLSTLLMLSNVLKGGGAGGGQQVAGAGWDGSGAEGFGG
jgi:hypothetical protein